MADPCPHPIGNAKACTECMYEGNIPETPNPTWQGIGPALNAKFPGTCPIGDDPIELGETVLRVQRGDREAWAHQRCLLRSKGAGRRR